MTDRIKENYTESIQTKIAAAEALPDDVRAVEAAPRADVAQLGQG